MAKCYCLNQYNPDVELLFHWKDTISACWLGKRKGVYWFLLLTSLDITSSTHIYILFASFKVRLHSKWSYSQHVSTQYSQSINQQQRLHTDAPKCMSSVWKNSDFWCIGFLTSFVIIFQYYYTLEKWYYWSFSNHQTTNSNVRVHQIKKQNVPQTILLTTPKWIAYRTAAASQLQKKRTVRIDFPCSSNAKKQAKK